MVAVNPHVQNTSGTYQPKSAQIVKTNANYINGSQVIHLIHHHAKLNCK